MDNYEDKSDSQINVYVHLIVDPEWKDSDELDVPNYCESPSDAWPIITENRISVSPVQTGINRYHPAKDLWRANHYRDYNSVFTKSGDNPLRCAMIVFLKMQEAPQ